MLRPRVTDALRVMPSRQDGGHRLLVAAMAYLVLACALMWPLPRELQTSLPGDPGGDLGNYVWNVWVFGHELVDHGRLPLSTEHVFASTDGADFSLHNFTPLAGLLALPLTGFLGVVGAFNLTLLLFLAAAGSGVFVLARRLGIDAAAAWCAGALFMASPTVVAKTTAHVSLVNAAPLPLFLWALLRVFDTRHLRDAAILGALVALATYADAYYGIYCVLMGGFFVTWRFVRVEWQRRPADSKIRAVRQVCDLAVLSAAALIAWRGFSGTTTITAGPLRIGLQTLYTPVLVIMCLVALRIAATWHIRARLQADGGELRRLLRLALVAVGVCLGLLLPLLIGIGTQAATGQLPGTETFWRSSPRGVDALAYLVPNPNHAWFGASTQSWFMPRREDAFPEFVGSFSLVALVVIVIAALRRRLPPVWLAFTAWFIWLSFGPFMYVAGVNSYVIGPWALLRFVPILGMARSPSRFAVVATLGLTILFGFAIRGRFRSSAAPRWAFAAAMLLLAIEVAPAPRVLYSAAVPEIYSLIRTKGDEAGRLLELPTGIRDGTSSIGNFAAVDQFFQTAHRRPLIGGYLSRVSARQRLESGRRPMLRALFALSEGRTPPPEWLDEARQGKTTFLRRACVRFVVVDKRRASRELREFAVDALNLSLVHEDDTYALLTPSNPPECDPIRRRGRWTVLRPRPPDRPDVDSDRF